MKDCGDRDMLVKLYDLPDIADLQHALRERGVVVRRALALERTAVTGWIRTTFGESWADECEFAFFGHPITCMIATAERQVVGFQAFNIVAPGVVGPSGLDASLRGGGIGKVLIIKALQAMRDAGYAYAVLGWISPANQEYFAKTVGAVVIEGSAPFDGTYNGLLSRRMVVLQH